MSELESLPAGKTPTVYFIDDSATMREVIKIAFRRESIRVVTCPDAASAIAQFSETAPDAVITDVIMPDKDGYEVCQLIKQDPKLSQTPVVLMSGVVNRSVAERAIAVQADELVRKPFQPQELIARVKNLLHLGPAQPAAAAEMASSRAPQPAPEALSGIFGPAAPLAPPAPASRPPAPAAPPHAHGNTSAHPAGPPAIEAQKLRREIERLQMLVRKLQSELEAERNYVASLEEHLKTLQEAE